MPDFPVEIKFVFFFMIALPEYISCRHDSSMVILIADRVAGQANLQVQVYLIHCRAWHDSCKLRVPLELEKYLVKQLDLFMNGKIVLTIHLLKE